MAAQRQISGYMDIQSMIFSPSFAYLLAPNQRSKGQFLGSHSHVQHISKWNRLLGLHNLKCGNTLGVIIQAYYRPTTNNSTLIRARTLVLDCRPSAANFVDKVSSLIWSPTHFRESVLSNNSFKRTVWKQPFFYIKTGPYIQKWHFMYSKYFWWYIAYITVYYVFSIDNCVLLQPWSCW